MRPAHALDLAKKNIFSQVSHNSVQFANFAEYNFCAHWLKLLSPFPLYFVLICTLREIPATVHF